MREYTTEATGESGVASKGVLPPPRELLALFGILVLAFLINLGVGFFWFRFSWGSILAGFGIMGLIITALAGIVTICIPFILGRIVGKDAWLYGLSYGLLVAFIGVPLVFNSIEWNTRYFWFVKGPKSLLIIIPVVAAGTGLAALGGMKKWKKRLDWVRFGLKLDYARKSMVCVSILALALSALGPAIFFGVYGTSVPGDTIVKFPQYNFEILKPRGFALRTYEHRTYGVSGRLWKQSDAQIMMDTWGENTTVFDEVSVFVFSKMPFTGVPLDSYNSADDAYDAFMATMEDVKNDPTKYFEQSVSPSGRIVGFEFADFKLYGDTTIGGVKALRVGYREYHSPKSFGDMSEEQPLPSSDPTCDIVVYRKPYLYWLHMVVRKDLYKRIEDSFAFL